MRIDVSPRHKNAPRPAWKVCPFCNEQFARPERISDAQWEARVHCTQRCAKSVPARVILQTNHTKTDGPLSTQCWIWNGTTRRNGYGQVIIKRDGVKHTWRAHRLSYREFCGDPGNLLVCHRCDNRACINPLHLFLGTHKGNSDDMDAKGRRKAITGDQKPSSKLTVEAVQEIKRGGRPIILAAKFGVSESLIHKVRQGKAWGWVNA